jgi:DNA primase
MGTAVTEKQIKKIQKYTNNIILYLDPDLSGQKAMKRSLKKFNNNDVTLKLATDKNGLDPADKVKELKNDFWPWLLKNAKTIEQYYVDKFMERYNSQIIDAKRELLNNLGNVFKDRTNKLETEFALTSVCNTLNVDVSTLKEKIKNQ